MRFSGVRSPHSGIIEQYHGNGAILTAVLGPQIALQTKYCQFVKVKMTLTGLVDLCYSAPPGSPSAG